MNGTCCNRWCALAVVLATLAFSSGCEERVLSDYGIRSNLRGTSLNGTRVLGDMFSKAGHRVLSRTALTPSVNNADVIVWFPDDFEAPNVDVEHWLTDWLTAGDSNEPPHVLIYVGRDFDAAPNYWQRMQAMPPKGLKAEYARRLTEAKADATANRPATLGRSETHDWFHLDTSAPLKKVDKLSGPWAASVDSTRIEIEKSARLVPLDMSYTKLLTDQDGEPIASEYSYIDYDESPSGRLIMIENGSWLLNARLVNHEHRKLAGRLVDTVGQPRRTVVFLESDAGGPPILESDPNVAPPTGFEMFRVWPIGAVLTQLAALGLVFAMMKWPIFGTPRRTRRASTSDFRSHITALGRLLRYGRSRNYAAELLRIYRQSVRRDAPATDPPPTPPSNLASE